jgi:hypothetical protein
MAWGRGAMARLTPSAPGVGAGKGLKAGLLAVRPIPGRLAEAMGGLVTRGGDRRSMDRQRVTGELVTPQRAGLRLSVSPLVAPRRAAERLFAPLRVASLIAAPLLAVLSWPLAPPLRAAPPATIRPDEFPPASLFRTLQLTALACGRDNTAERCAEARRLADPLLDHPRLPARCKDVLWSIRNLAVEAPANSLARRDPIDQAAAEVTVACRQVLKVKPEGKPQGAPPAAGEGGVRFGGGRP